MSKKTKARDEAIAKLNQLAEDVAPHDPEAAHGEADGALLDYLRVVEPDVAVAYEKVVQAARWWSTA